MSLSLIEPPGSRAGGRASPPQAGSRGPRVAGATQADARKGSPVTLSLTEVMEIFRFDGSRWVY